MERRVELFEAPEIATIEITEPLPDTGVVDSTYKIKGSVKIFDAIGAPPWVYAEVRLKEWYKPEAAEEVSYKRGFPMPISGDFTIDLKPEKEGDYEVTVLATPAPLSLPVVGVFPVTGKSDAMKIAVGERPPAVFRFSGVTIDGNNVPLTNHDADSGLLLEKTTADYLDITPAFEWTGPSKTVIISVKAGYKDWLGAFSPKTGAYTRTFTLPESPAVPYAGELESPIRVPLTAAGGLTDGAIEIVLKIAGEPDYISRIWNVYATKAPPEVLDFDLVKPTVSETPVEPGTAISITCPITSRCEMAVDARAKVIIYEGSVLPGHGSKIREYDSGSFHIEPGESKDVIIHHTAIVGTIDRRDVEVEVYVDTQLVKESEWDDVFYVGVPPEEIIDFDLTRPTVTPAEIFPGTEITLTCPVTSACTKEQTATAKVKIYEGSFYAGHGALITTKTSTPFSIVPGQTYDVIVHHTAIAGTIDRRDVEVEVYVGGKLIKENEWDDVYYVIPPPVLPEADIRNLDFQVEEGTYDIGDSVPYDAPYEYKGKTQGGWLTISLGTGVYPSFFTKYTYSRKAVSFSEAMDWTSGEFFGTFILPATLEPGQTYNTRAKLETADGAQIIDTDWGVISIPEAPPVPPASDLRNLDFQAEKGTYDIGDRVPYDAPYEYKGKAQSGWLTIYLGTGVYPYFSIKYTYPRTAVSFSEAMDWTPGQLSGSFFLPSILQAGQTYNTRAKLETADGEQIIDTDWGVISIPEAPPVPPPKADIRNLDFEAEKGTYEIGDKVPFTCDYEYKGKAQSGQLVLSLGTGVYPYFTPVVNYSPMPIDFEKAMDWTRRSFEGTFELTEALEPGRLYNTRAKLETLDDRTQETDTDWSVLTIREEAPPGEYTISISVSPLGAGYVIREPHKDKYAYGETVKLTAIVSGIYFDFYKFSSWTVDGEWAGSTNPLNLMVTKDLEVKASFTEI